jgi:deoxycytidine triphosphate deaminase
LVLSKLDIVRYLDEQKLIIDPPVSTDRIAQVSIDLRLGRKFSAFKKPPPYLPAIHVDPSLWSSVDLWEHRESPVYRLDTIPFKK